MTEPTAVPGPDDQDIDLYAELPRPEDVGESSDDPVASHGDFHHRPPLEDD